MQHRMGSHETMAFQAYESLEAYRPCRVERLSHHDVVLLEKIHGANVQFYMTQHDKTAKDPAYEGHVMTLHDLDQSPSCDGTDSTDGDDSIITDKPVAILFGKRSSWVAETENFFSHMTVVTAHVARMTQLYHIIAQGKDAHQPPIVRVFGELYGGLFKGETAPNATMVQKRTSYCPHNAFAAFDIYVDNVPLHWDIVKDVCSKADIHTVPEVARGKLSTLLETFDVDKLTTRVPTELHGLEDPQAPAEGVVIKSLAQNPTEDELLGMKLKQRRMLEQPVPRIKDPQPVNLDLFKGYMNQNRFDCYRSKVGNQDLMNRRLMRTHLVALVDDASASIKEDYPDLTPSALKRIGHQLTLSAREFIMTFDGK